MSAELTYEAWLDNHLKVWAPRFVAKMLLPENADMKNLILNPKPKGKPDA